MMSRSGAKVAALVSCCILTATRGAQAQTYSIVSVTNASIGRIAAAASGVTVFQINTTTTVLSGAGAYISGPVGDAVVTINCVDGTQTCASSAARVSVSATGVNTGRGQTITTMGAQGSGGSRTSGTDFSSRASLDFSIRGWTQAGNIAFLLYMYLPVLGDNASLATTASSQFKVGVAPYPTAPSSFTFGTVTGTIQRALQITKQSNLNFGEWVRPTSGSNVATIGTNGTRGISGSGNGYTGPPGLAQAGAMTASGEPGATFSLAYPTTFTMTGPSSSTIPVTLNSNVASGAQTLSGSGSLSILFGGSFPFTSNTTTGAYNGVFTVTVTYN